MDFYFTKSVKAISLSMVKSMDFKQLKARLINHLKKQMKKEETKEFSKSLAVFEIMQKAAFPVGTIREWKGKKYIKTAPGKWMRKYDNARDRGFNRALKNVMRQMETADSPEELLQIVLKHSSRFRDGNGNMLPEVQQLHELSQKKQSGMKEPENKTEEKQGKIPSGYVNDLSIEKQGELNKLLKEHFKNEGMSGMDIADAVDNAMDSKISDLEEIYNKNKKVKDFLMNIDSDSSSFKLSDIYDRNVHDEMKKVQSFDEAKNVIKQIADNYGPTEKGRKLLENFMSYNVGGSSPIYDKVYEHFGISYNDLDADFDAAKDKILKLASGKKDVTKEDKKIKQGKDDFEQKYREGIENEDKNFQKQNSETQKEVSDTINSYYDEMLEYTDWGTTSKIKKLGEKKLKEIASVYIDIDKYKEKLLNAAMEKIKEYPERKDDIISEVKNLIYSKAWDVNLTEKARKKLDTINVKENEVDLPVSEQDMSEAKSIIGSDVDRILSGRDTYGNAKQTLADKIRRRFRNNPGVCRAMLVYIKQEQEKTGKEVFTSRNSIWELLPKLNENAKEAKTNGETETKTGVSGNIYSGKDGTTIVENKDWGRYQIALPGKPEQKIITALKQHGFKWSPSTKTWVGFNTANGERKMHEMAEILGLEKEEMLKSFSKSMDLETLKKMVINHLKKQDKKELSKSLAVNEILQKANFPVGTVREWKGKKYKKIAPGKWARMYNSKGRGTNIAVGKLIARVNKIDNVEDLMKLCMEHKQRFADTDILNKIRAAVDAQNNKINGKENVSSNNTKTNNKTSSDLDELNNMLSQLNSLANKGKDRTKVYNELKKQYKDKLAKLGEKVKFDNAKGKYVETFETEKENVSSNKNDFKLNNNNYKHETSNKKTTEVVSYTVETPKKNIGEVINKGNNTVEIPSNKQAKFELEQLLKHKSDDKLRQFMNNVYYDEGKLIATNGRTLKTVQVGELGDIPNGSYVELDTKGKNIVIKEIQRPADRFPAWQRVMPEGYTNKASINGKALLDKIKEMEKDGSFAKNKDNRIVRLDIKDGQISLDGTVVGQTNDIQGSTNFQFTKDYLKNVLSPNDLTLMFSGRDDKERYAMSISNETSDNIIMPLWNGDREVTEYEKNRQEAKFAKEKEKTDLENKEKRNYSLSKDFYDMQTKQFDNLSPQKIATFQDGVKNAKNEQIEKWVKIANVDMDKLMKEKDFSNYSTFYKWTDKNYGVNQYNFVIYHKIFQNQELANTLFDEAQKRGISVKKSILVQVKDIFYGGNF